MPLAEQQQVKWNLLIVEASQAAIGWVYLDSPLALAVDAERQQLLAIAEAALPLLEATVLATPKTRLSSVADLVGSLHAAVRVWQREQPEHGPHAPKGGVDGTLLDCW